MDSALDKQLRESIAYFEQILSVLPNDAAALEFLCLAYSQLGEVDKLLKYAVALTDVIVRTRNSSGALELVERLKDIDDPRAKAAVLRLQVLAAPQPKLVLERPQDGKNSATPSVAAAAELNLLEKLVADGVLNRNLVRSAFDQLMSVPSENGVFLISALQILEKENLTGASDAIAAVADAAHAPPVPLDAFEIPLALVRRLDMRLVKVRGVVPFARVGGEYAVAMLNPLDPVLRQEVSQALRARCHFFLAPPATIDSVLERIFRAAEESPVTVISDEPPPAMGKIG